MIWAVVPAKTGRTAKERLTPALPASLRTQLAEAMLDDVLTTLGECAELRATVVVSREEETLELARRKDATALLEQGTGGLNPAVAQGIAHCVENGATGVLVAMGDLPLLEAGDVRGALENLPQRGQVLVPSADGTGTNLVLSRPADIFEPHFGPDSLRLHRAAAEHQKIPTVLFPCPGPSLDIDTPGDLERLQSALRRPSATARLLSEHGRAIPAGARGS